MTCNSRFTSALRAGAADRLVIRLANRHRSFAAARVAHSTRTAVPFAAESTVTGH
jgi:transcriptional regulator NrdR family protein